MYQKRVLSVILLISFFPLSRPVLAEPIHHVVQRGETIYSIARRYGVPQAIIIAENDIPDPRNVSVGTALRIPGTHEVQPGESYYGIARRYSVEMSELLALNDRTEDSILRVGDVLLLPSDASSPTATSTSTDSAATDDGGANPDNSSQRDIVTSSWPLPGARRPLSGKLPGVMISGNVGDEVRSIASGRVRYTGTYSAFGRVVMVQSPEGYLYVYGGTDRIIVSVGDLVTPGALLGVLGNGPHSEEPALYFSVFRGSKPVSPEDAPRG